jgi:hypothetical protein
MGSRRLGHTHHSGRSPADGVKNTVDGDVPQPFYIVAMVSTVAMSFSGVGAIDATATPQQSINTLRVCT